MTNTMTVHLLQNSLIKELFFYIFLLSLKTTSVKIGERRRCIYLSLLHSFQIIMNKPSLTNLNVEYNLFEKSHQTRRSKNYNNISSLNPQSKSTSSSKIRPNTKRRSFSKNIDVSIIQGHPQLKTWLIDIHKILDDQFPQQPDEDDEVC